MEDYDTSKLYFYPSKGKNIVLMMIGLVFIAVGFLICVVAFKEGDFIFSGVGALIGLVFGFIVYAIGRGILSSKPYLILTEEALIINAVAKNNAFPIQWDDIIGYNIRNVNFNKFIEILLYDEEKYRARMSKTKKRLNKVNDFVGSTLFAIGWGQIKRKDRRKLVYELDRLNRRGFKLTDHLYPQMNAANKEQKSGNRVNRNYLLTSYGYSLILAGVASLLFYGGRGGDNHDMMLIVVSFFLYPFAKTIYDTLLGFKLDDKIRKQSFVILYIYQLRFLIHLLLYLFSFYIAPFGILYLILRPFYRLIQRRRYKK